MAAFAAHGIDFADPVIFWVMRALWLLVMGVEVVAFVNCLTQRAEAFPVVGSVPKGGWLALTGGAIFFTALLGLISFLGLIAVAAALIYLLDVRPALRDAVDGHGSW
jgi:hypothetical protein